MDMFLGIDLGTTNSAAALSDGNKITLVQSAQGGVITPSVVRIDGRGKVTVGQRARRFLESDPDNTRAEFKRLMGSERKLHFAAAKLDKTPPELAAEVLRMLREDVAQQTGGPAPDRAVITVPAMFELPQSAATAEAARIAGFQQVEFLQEPVASAIAAGWNADDHAQSWLVYDLGGGTFDVSLLETKEGILRVVGHDGDNFLGGRDLDSAICEAVIAQIEKQEGQPLDRRANAVALRRLRVLAEEAKLDAGRGSDLTIAAPALFTIGEAQVDVDIVIPHAAFRELVLAIADRSLAVCERLLAAHGVVPTDLGKVVLVGGPTMMAILRDRVANQLRAPIVPGLDPMTLVAQGASMFAATSRLAMRAAPIVAQAAAQIPPNVWLQYPMVTPDVAPFVVGKLLTDDAKKRVRAVRFKRADGSWTGELEAVDGEGTFAASVSLVARASTDLVLEGLDSSGNVVPLEPGRISIRHGITLSDPPLSRTIGIALANDGVQVFFERGSPLPMRRTFVRHTAEAIAPGAGSALMIPIVQGEFNLAHLCRLVGMLEIPAASLDRPLPAATPVELTLSVDRGGGLTATAHVPYLGRAFQGVAQLASPNLPPAAVRELAEKLRARTESLYQERNMRENPATQQRLMEIDHRLGRVLSLAERAEAGDDDAGEQAAREIWDIDGELSRVESDNAWPELDRKFQLEAAWTAGELLENGSDAERRAFEDTTKAFHRARSARDEREAQRQLHLITRLGNAAYFRRDDAWSEQFHYCASRVSEATDLVAAQRLVEEGRRADAAKDKKALERIVGDLQRFLPSRVQDRVRSHGSGVR